MYSKIKNDDKRQTCRRSSSSCQMSPSATWQLEWLSEKQKGEEEGPCSPNKRWWLLVVVFTVFHLRHPSSSSSICIIMFVVHQHHRVHVRRHGHRRCVVSLPWWCCHRVVLVVVVSWCWSVVVASWLWLWSPLLVATSSRVMTWHLVLWLTTKWGVVMGTYLCWAVLIRVSDFNEIP